MSEISSQTPSSPASTEEVVYVEVDRVMCDGGGGALGHPKVWYTLRDGRAECGYCGRIFVRKMPA